MPRGPLICPFLGLVDFCAVDMQQHRKAAPLENIFMDIVALDIGFPLALLNRHMRCFRG